MLCSERHFVWSSAFDSASTLLTMGRCYLACIVLAWFVINCLYIGYNPFSRNNIKYCDIKSLVHVLECFSYPMRHDETMVITQVITPLSLRSFFCCLKHISCNSNRLNGIFCHTLKVFGTSLVIFIHFQDIGFEWSCETTRKDVSFAFSVCLGLFTGPNGGLLLCCFVETIRKKCDACQSTSCSVKLRHNFIKIYEIHLYWECKKTTTLHCYRGLSVIYR